MLEFKGNIPSPSSLGNTIDSSLKLYLLRITKENNDIKKATANDLIGIFKNKSLKDILIKSLGEKIDFKNPNTFKDGNEFLEFIRLLEHFINEYYHSKNGYDNSGNHDFLTPKEIAGIELIGDKNIRVQHIIMIEDFFKFLFRIFIKG